MDKIFNDQARQIVDPTDFLDLVSFRNRTHNIMNLRSVIGDEKYIMLLERFSASYTRFPTFKNSLEAVNDIILVHLWYEVVTGKKSGNLKAWNDADARFIRHAQFIKMEYQHAIRRAKAVTKELVEARNWANQHDQPQIKRPVEE